MQSPQLLAPHELQRIIETALPSSTVQVTDLTGTRDHYRVEVVAEQFEGKTRLQQHQMIYKAVGEHMTQAVHALQIRTRTP